MEAKSTVSGNTKGIILGIAKSRNLIIREKSKSLPANSVIKSQTLWSMNIKNKITNTEVNVIKNVFRMYLSRIFTSN